MATEQSTERGMITLTRKGREPGEKRPKDVGNQAFNDAVILVMLAWGFLIFIHLSVRRHNV
jgi:hypothetical protein